MPHSAKPRSTSMLSIRSAMVTGPAVGGSWSGRTPDDASAGGATGAAGSVGRAEGCDPPGQAGVPAPF